MDPVNFQFQDPSQAILGGIKQSAILGQIRQDAQAQQLQMQQAQLQQQQALQRQQDIQGYLSNPSHQGAAALMLKYPELHKQAADAVKLVDDDKKQNLLNGVSRVYSALDAGNTTVALSLVRERQKAETDPAEAQHLKMVGDLIESGDPAAIATAQLQLGSALSALSGVEHFTENYGKLGGERRAQQLAPSVLKKAEGDASQSQSEAVIKAEQAKVAPQSVLLDLQKKGWDIKAIQEDIEYKKQSNRIAAMNAATAKEGNSLRAQELKLKIQETQTKLDEKVREQVANAESSAATIDNMLNTIERVKKNKSLNSVVGSVEGNDYYPNATMGTLNPFGNGDERADAIALIETLGSQAFMAQIPQITGKGLGQLSNEEGKKIQTSFQNLSRKQSEKQFRDNLDEAERLLKIGRENLSKKTGVPLAKPDTPAAPGARPPLSAFEKK